MQTKETQALILTILDVQPRESGAAGGKSSDEIVHELAETILYRIKEYINPDLINPKLVIVSYIFSIFIIANIVMIFHILSHQAITKITVIYYNSVNILHVAPLNINS